MKTIALLWISAALAFAVDQDPAKKAADPKAADPKTAGPAAPSKAAHPPAAAVQPARRNLHHAAVTPASGTLTPEQKAAAALPAVPKGAEEVGPNLFRYTDAQGKRWMYRNTPFGVSKWEEKPGEQPAPETSSSAGITATDLGDNVQFQRATPFGPQKWTRKKSELTDDEKAALATQQHAQDAAVGIKPEKQ
jgi:hypothetical protein